MSSDADEYEEHELTPEEQVEIIEWAVGTSALATLMFNAENADTDEEKAFKLEAFEAAVLLMIENMPDVLADPAILRADQAVENYMIKEAIVEKFMQQVEDFSNNGD